MHGEKRRSRGGRIRTDDVLVPNQARYQTALHPEKQAEQVGFEPTELLHPTVFKTAAISQTLPLLQTHKRRAQDSNLRDFRLLP